MKLVSFAAALLAATVLSGAASAKTLVFCSEGSPEGFNPAFYSAGTTFDATSRPVYNRLVDFERGTTNMVPSLAESWETSDDGLEVTFKLRQGVKFHGNDQFTPTREFNADDVIFTFERQGKTDHPYHAVSGATYQYFNSKSMPDLIKEIVKVDDHTVKFVLTKFDVTFVAVMAMDFASIFSAEYADKMMEAGTPEVVDTTPIGTGPFRFVAYQQDAVIRYEAFPDYFEGPAKIDNLVYAITPDASVRYQKLKAGECHVMPYPNPADIEAMRTDADINLLEQEGFNVGYVGYHTQKPPLDDHRVRKALNMAIDKQAIIEAVYQGAGVVAKNPIPPSMWSYNEDVVDDPYDPEAAKALLAEAGHPDGLTIDLWAMPVARPYNPDARRMAEMIQADWADVGVKAEIVSFEWGEYLEKVRLGEQQTYMLGWTADIADPDNFMSVLLGCESIGANNRSFWCHQPYEDLIQAAKQTADVEERTRLYKEAQVIFKEQAPWATIANSVVFKPVRKEVVDFKISPFGAHIFYDVDLAE